MNEEFVRYLIARILDCANEAKEEYDKDKSDFNSGKKLAFYEMANVINNELIANDVDTNIFGMPDIIETLL